MEDLRNQKMGEYNNTCAFRRKATGMNHLDGDIHLLYLDVRLYENAIKNYFETRINGNLRLKFYRRMFST